MLSDSLQTPLQNGCFSECHANSIRRARFHLPTASASPLAPTHENRSFHATRFSDSNPANDVSASFYHSPANTHNLPFASPYLQWFAQIPYPFPPAAANQSKGTEDTYNALLHQRRHFPQLFIVRFLPLTHCHKKNTSSSLTVVFSIPYPPAVYKECLLSELTARNPNGKVSVTRPKHKNRQK